MRFPTIVALIAIVAVRGDINQKPTNESEEFWRRYLATPSMSLDVGPCKVAESLTCIEKTTNIDCKKVVAPSTEACRMGSVKSSMCYGIKVDNIGDSLLDITKLVFVLNGGRDDILETLDVKKVPPGQGNFIQICKEVDLCVNEFNAQAVVHGRPPEGEICQALTGYIFTLIPPSPVPVHYPTSHPVATSAPIQTPPTPVPEPLDDFDDDYIDDYLAIKYY
jgi:hypothetical protein